MERNDGRVSKGRFLLEMTGRKASSLPRADLT